MQAAIANQVITAYDTAAKTGGTNAGITAGQARYVAWFGSPSRQLLYGKYQDGVDIILQTTISPVTGEDYGTCIVA